MNSKRFAFTLLCEYCPFSSSIADLFRPLFLFSVQFAAGLCCGLSCLAAGGTIGVIGDAGVRGFGLKAERGRKWFWAEGADGDDAGGDFGSVNAAEGANKLYVGMLIMLIFSEALALYGLIVALILSQHSYSCV